MSNKIYFIIVISCVYIFSVNAQHSLSWKLTNEFPGGAKTGIAESGDSLVFVSLKNGVIRSTDKGNSFQQVLSSGKTYSIFSDSKRSVFVGGEGCVYISTDGGTVWDSVSLDTDIPVQQFIEYQDIGIFAITHFLNNHLEYVGDGVFFSSDGGYTWTKRNNGLNPYLISERIAADRNGRLYLTTADQVMTGRGGLFISDDTGNSWLHVPIEMDGKGVINDHPRIQYTHGLSVIKDTVYLSFEGSSGGGYVILNLKIAINDLNEHKAWQYTQANTQYTWYMDTPLQNQFVASNNTVYSSSVGTINQGKSYVKYCKDDSWHAFDAGLGAGEYGFREPQHFIEMDNKVLMVQEHDERIYWMSLDENVVSFPSQEIQETRLWPNPVQPGNEVYLSGHNEDKKYNIAVSTLSGKIIMQDDRYLPGNSIQAPNRRGFYVITVSCHEYRQAYQLIVH